MSAPRSPASDHYNAVLAILARECLCDPESVPPFRCAACQATDRLWALWEIATNSSTYAELTTTYVQLATLMLEAAARQCRVSANLYSGGEMKIDPRYNLIGEQFTGLLHGIEELIAKCPIKRNQFRQVGMADLDAALVANRENEIVRRTGEAATLGFDRELSEDIMRSGDEAMAQTASGRHAVGTGFVTVPIKPTPEMLRAASNSVRQFSADRAATVYSAMLRAAQQTIPSQVPKQEPTT